MYKEEDESEENEVLRIRAVKTEGKNVLFRVVWAGRRISTWEYAEKVAHLDVALDFLTNARKTGGRSTPESRRTAEYASNVINTIKNLTKKYEENTKKPFPTVRFASNE